jgi:hypothetical protein
MFKLASLALFALASSLPMAHAAAPSKAIFKGNYDGVCKLEAVAGKSIVYSPLRFKISKTGLITGTASNDKSKVLSQVTGKIDKVTVQNKTLYSGKASGKFSDGTSWTAQVNADKGSSAKYISVKCKQGAYTGSARLVNRGFLISSQ